MSRPLKLAIQKSGRLSEDSIALLSDCDIRFPSAKTSRAIRCASLNFPLEILLVRDDDIPQYVADGAVDMGILGENVSQESEFPLTLVERLNFGYCRLSFAAPNNSKIKSSEGLRGKRIATSYPKLTKAYLESRDIQADIHVINGSVEVAPSLGLADAISDLVGTGSTLITNGLTEIETILNSQAVLVARSKLDPEVQSIADKFLFRLRSVEKGRNLKYLMLNVESKDLEKVSSLLQGLRSPTVLPLSTTSWFAVHAVVSGDGLWEIIESLKEVGAEGIVVSSIEKMIP